MNGGTVTRVGSSALSGWRGSLGRSVASQVSRRTRFSKEQVEAAIGFMVIGYTAYRLARPLVAAARRR